MESKTYSVEEFGDFQTPKELVSQVISRLSRDGWKWGRVLEPTCGVGNFIEGILDASVNVKEIVGIELRPEYSDSARKFADYKRGVRTEIENKNIFSVNLKQDIPWKTGSPLLVIGNPPWVTNSKIGSINGSNLPRKHNAERLNGYAALTGASNFDISEYILIKIIRELADENPTVAMLCKTAVARKVMSFCQKHKLPINHAKIIQIDAFRWFNASTDACVFIFSVGEEERNYDAEVYDTIASVTPVKKIGFRNGNIISNKGEYLHLSHIDGYFPFVWRQGVKHDASSVVELRIGDDGVYYNKYGELVDVEDEYLYPFVKSSDLNKSDPTISNRWIIVPQKRLHDDTSLLSVKAPKLWAYFSKHRAAFQKRKSSMYRNKPEFTYFGLGDYTFSNYKLAISGLYKEPRFRELGKHCGKPIIPDDTCYFIPCASMKEASELAEILNGSEAKAFLKSITFKDSMRPITKSVLQRINLHALTDSTFSKSSLLNY